MALWMTIFDVEGDIRKGSPFPPNRFILVMKAFNCTLFMMGQGNFIERSHVSKEDSHL